MTATKTVLNAVQQKNVTDYIKLIVAAPDADARADCKRDLIAYVDEIAGTNYKRRRLVMDEVERQLANAYV